MLPPHFFTRIHLESQANRLAKCAAVSGDVLSVQALESVLASTNSSSANVVRLAPACRNHATTAHRISSAVGSRQSAGSWSGGCVRGRLKQCTQWNEAMYSNGLVGQSTKENEDRVSMKNKSTLVILAVYAVAMALLESAVVIYMRHLYYAANPLEIFPLRFLDSYDTVLELSREVATVVMILTVALLADRSSRTRTFAAFVFVFGVWDLFYYFWLKVLLGWPVSWLEWDVLFLIPSVWLGPWICPAMISVLFIVWGAWTLGSNNNISLTPRSTAMFVTGAALGLIAFLQPAAHVLIDGGVTKLAEYTPGSFWWWLFIPGYLLMTCSLTSTLRAPTYRPRPRALM